VTVLKKKFGNRDELYIYIKFLRIIREESPYLWILRQRTCILFDMVCDAI